MIWNGIVYLGVTTKANTSHPVPLHWEHYVKNPNLNIVAHESIMLKFKSKYSTTLSKNEKVK